MRKNMIIKSRESRLKARKNKKLRISNLLNQKNKSYNNQKLKSKSLQLSKNSRSRKKTMIQIRMTTIKTAKAWVIQRILM